MSLTNPSASKPETLMIAGGGTGGHILAGVAVADAWRAKFGEDARAVFVGAQGGIEEKLVPRHGYPLKTLKLGALKRTSILNRLKTLFLLPFAFFKSFLILVSTKPKVVLGVGGYSSGPLVLTAKLLGIPTAILEQNSVSGFTNRILGQFVDSVFCAFPGTEAAFPIGRAVVLGNPVRSSMRLLPAASKRPFTVFIFGGSQGALSMNTVVLDALKHLEDLKPHLRFIHQTGEVDFERVSQAHEVAGFQSRVEKFIHDMPSAYAEASLLICRAGSSTLSEIAAVGRAAVLIPLPTAADNHQEINARVFSDHGAAFLFSQKSSRGGDLARLIRNCYENPAEIEQVEKAVSTYHRPNAAQDIVERIQKMIHLVS